MKFEDFAYYQKSREGISEIKKLWEKIEANSVKDMPLYLEWLALRVFLSMGVFQNDPSRISNMKLDNDFAPLKIAPPNKPDLFIEYPTMGLIIEVTERPVSGKVEHFSHTMSIEKKSSKNLLGLLLVRHIEDVDNEVWNTYKSHYENEKLLFIIGDFEFIIKIIDKYQDKSIHKFLEFVKESESLWKKMNDWKIIKENILKLRKKMLED